DHREPRESAAPAQDNVSEFGGEQAEYSEPAAQDAGALADAASGEPFAPRPQGGEGGDRDGGPRRRRRGRRGGRRHRRGSENGQQHHRAQNGGGDQRPYGGEGDRDDGTHEESGNVAPGYGETH